MGNEPIIEEDLITIKLRVGTKKPKPFVELENLISRTKSYLEGKYPEEFESSKGTCILFSAGVVKVREINRGYGFKGVVYSLPEDHGGYIICIIDGVRNNLGWEGINRHLGATEGVFPQGDTFWFTDDFMVTDPYGDKRMPRDSAYRGR